MKGVIVALLLLCVVIGVVNGQQSQPQVAQSGASSNATSSSSSQTTTTTTEPNAGGGGGGGGGGAGAAATGTGGAGGAGTAQTGNQTGAGGNETKPSGAQLAGGSPDNSILQQIGSIDKLSMVKLALGKGELKDISTMLDNKNGSQQYTLFAPTNDAIMALAQAANTSKANETFSPEDKEGLMIAGIHYHILPKKLLTTDIKELALPKTLLNDSKFVNLPGGQAQRLHLMTEQLGTDKKVQVWFGLDKDGQAKKSNVVVADIQCANGVIHIIDKVIDVPLEPSKILQAGGLTRFLDALKAQNLDKKLDNTSGLTIFAPVNSAFDVAKGQDKELNSSLANLLQEGLFYIHANSSGVITFKKGGDSEATGGTGAATGAGAGTGGAGAATGGTGAAGGNATAGGATTGVRKLLQAIQNATGTGDHTGHGGAATGEATGAGGTTGGVTATKVNNTQWKLSGSFKNWNVDGVSILVHDVITKNGVMHVIDKIVGMPMAGGGGGAGGAGNKTSNVSMTCSDIKCPAGDQCCEVSIDSPENAMPRCYSPNTHVCASRGNFLCGKDAPFVCGIHCYSKSQYVCVNSLLLCPVTAPNACGVACYDAAQFKCMNGNLQLLGQEEKKAQRS